MIWPSKWRHLKGLSDIMALASFRRDDPRHYLTSPLFATEPLRKPSLSIFLFLITSPSEVYPPRESPLCFFCLAGARFPRAGSADSLKPHALRVPSSRRAGLERI